MIDQHTDFFKYVDNFAKTAHIPSIPIFESKLDYIPEITIAIPTYKRAHLLKEALDSAINQIDYTNYDIIVVDNNPERGCETEKLMMSYSNNPMISYYKNADNLGMAGNWNRLFTLAKGKYVVMLHDDDLLYPNYVSTILKSCSKLPNVDIVFPKHKSSYHRDFLSSVKNDHEIKGYKVQLKHFINGNIIGPPVGMCVKKSFYLKTKGFRDEFYPSIDEDFYMESCNLGNVYIISSELCTYYGGENESLKKETIIGFFNDAKRFNKRLSCELSFPFNILNRFAYRNLVHNTIKWTSKFADKSTIIEALETIGYKRNQFFDRISSIIAWIATAIKKYDQTRYEIYI